METFFYKFSVPADSNFANPVESPEFHTVFNDVSFTWKVDFSIGEYNARTFNLSLVAGADIDETATYSIRLIHKEGPAWHVDGIVVSMESGRKFGHFAYVFEFYPGNGMKKFSDGCFKILVKIAIPRRCFESKNFAKPVDHLVLPENSANELFDQVTGRAPVDEFSDMLLISSDNSNYYYHKFVLYSCSEYFKTKITRSHGQHLQIHMYDVDDETLTTVLFYIYTGQLMDENKMNLPLTEKCLSAAEKFKLLNLTSKLLSRLKFHLNQENVLHCLELADKYSCEMLSIACIEIPLLFEDRLHHRPLVRQLLRHIQKKSNVLNLVF